MRSKLEARLRRLRVISVERVFREALADSAERLTKLSGLLSDPPGIVHISEDARNLRLDNGSHRPAASVDFVITSPPYVGAQKYIRSCSLSLNWLGLCTPGEFRQLEDLNIGREHYPQASYQNSLHTRIDGVDILLDRVRQDNPLRAHIAATYLIELQDAFREIARVMKPGAYMVLVVGNNLVGSRQFETTRYAREILEKLGLQSILVLADEIRSRGLLTKRHHTAGMIHREHVSIYQKGVP
ncbi:MAG: hypothetical protein MJE77_13625 [Proteobacteria bacterium]|nr:hypothetical protein [Pseudomonadota bacterium]